LLAGGTLVAIYHVSLKKLSAVRGRLAEVTRPDTEPSADPGSPAQVENVSPSPQPVEAASPTDGIVASPASGDALAQTIEELLHLPRTQVGALLAACNDPTRKVLLALIYRLAAVEDELRDVAGRVRSGGARVLQPATFRPPPAAFDPQDGKSGLLEQVFHKNQSLRKQE
jgi:hypothetical protein